MSGKPPNTDSTEILKSPYRFKQLRYRLLRRGTSARLSGNAKSKNKTKWRTFGTLLSRRKHKPSLTPLQNGLQVTKAVIDSLYQCFTNCARKEGIKWAPFKVPLSRRCETFAIALFTFIGSFMPFLSYLMLFWLLFSQYWWLGLMYMVYILNDHQNLTHGNKRTKWMRNFWLWRYAANYFPLKLVKTAELDPTKNYIAPTSPHGQIIIGGTLAFMTNACDFDTLFPGIKSYFAMASHRVTAPFLREIHLTSGSVCVSPDTFTYLLDSKRHTGNLVALNLGGIKEMLLSEPGDYKLYVKNRRGYARMALKTGASIVPVFVFGETRLYKTEPYPKGTWMRKFQEIFSAITQIMPVIPQGRGFFQYSFGVIPHRVPVTVVVGAPIEVEPKVNPSDEEVEKLHEKYLQSLMELFKNHKHKYEADPNISLVFT